MCEVAESSKRALLEEYVSAVAESVADKMLWAG